MRAVERTFRRSAMSQLWSNSPSGVAYYLAEPSLEDGRARRATGAEIVPADAHLWNKTEEESSRFGDMTS